MRTLDLGPIDLIDLTPDKPTFEWDFSDDIPDDKNLSSEALSGYPSRSLQSVFARLYAYLSFPEDERQRNAILSTMKQSFSHAFDRLFEDPIIQDLAKKTYGEADGNTVLEWLEGKFRNIDRKQIGTFPSAPPNLKKGDIVDFDLATKGFWETRTCGITLYFLRCMHADGDRLKGGASLNKVIYLFEQKLKVSRTEVMRSWARSKSVSHLSAAYYEMAAIADNCTGGDRAAWAKQFGPFGDFGVCLQFLGAYLRLAREYQDFGTTFVPSGAKDALLDINKIWTLPSTLPQPEGNHPGRLPDDLIEFLNSYRAPKAI